MKKSPLPLITTVVGTVLPFLLEKKRVIKEGTVTIEEGEDKISNSRVMQFGIGTTLVSVGLSYIESNFKIAVFLISAGLLFSLAMEIIKRNTEA